MLDMRFVVDESGFEFSDETPGRLEATLLRFLDLLDYAKSTGAEIGKWSQIWSIEGRSGRRLADLLYASAEVDRDIRLLTGGRLDKLGCWDELDLNPPLDVLVAGHSVGLAPGIALCAIAHSRGRGVALLTTDQSGRRGSLEVSVSSFAPAMVHFLLEPIDGPKFWRSTVEVEDMDAEGLAAICPLAFPRLRFGDGTWRRVDRFDGSFRDLRNKLLGDLAGLDDYALDVWRQFAEPARIAAEMASRGAVNCSRDSPQTHRNAAAMAERDVTFEGRTVRCEWHTKLEAHRNRIHFAVLDDCILIGIFAAHLTT